MENHAPRVSVVMPVYNVAAYVEAAVASVLTQDFADFELLIVDDGSTDDSLARCQAFNDPRLRIICQANRGLAGARNTGIRHARGQYVAFLDSDDLWTPDKLTAHVAHLDADPRLGVSYCQSAFIDGHGHRLGVLQSPKLKGVSAIDVFLRNPIGNGSVPVIRRAALDAVCFPATCGGELRDCWFDESFRQSEDIECWTRIALQTAWQFGGIGRVLTLYRVNDGGLSAQVERQLASWERFYAKVCAYAPDFARHHGAQARGFQLRYLARRLVRMGRGPLALHYACRACLTAPAILLREPRRTLLTLAAASCATLLPQSAYRGLERVAMGLIQGWHSLRCQAANRVTAGTS